MYRLENRGDLEGIGLENRGGVKGIGLGDVREDKADGRGGLCRMHIQTE